MTSPCLRCGACCAHFRVSFYWTEAEPFLAGPAATHVPAELTVAVDPHRLAMEGTDGPAPRCVALEGAVGEHVRCRIYERRPSPCREFAPAWEQGQANERCNRARAAHGLAPLPDPQCPPGGTALERSA